MSSALSWNYITSEDVVVKYVAHLLTAQFFESSPTPERLVVGLSGLTPDTYLTGSAPGWIVGLSVFVPPERPDIASGTPNQAPPVVAFEDQCF
ncbi:hypothetical protein BDM02DRAFT_3194280 [Thelephora ganbajun]|uniref:Uncharacterized protein n=1 Tax=Thelephora ganbajun TaxID=370292 RepID=A0ACB6YXJ8_THEGA|nr:hypothetical protein BDM02DRAFT_3194280 [Thelephora ganbajun]